MTIFPVRKIEDGEIITEPGIYDISMDWYHQSCCEGPSLSSTNIRELLANSPLHMWDKWAHNPDRAPSEEKPHFVLGTATHSVLIEHARLLHDYAVQPLVYPAKDGELRPWTYNANWCKDWAASQTKPILTADQVIAIAGMQANIQKHDYWKAGAFEGEVERSLIWQDSETGLWLKARPDVIPTASNMEVDLKTTRDASPRAVRNTIEDRGYHIQRALIGLGFEAVLRRKVEMHVLMFVETTRPYAVNGKPISDHYIGPARRLIRMALRRVAQCLRDNEWPSYDDDGVEAHPSDHFMRRIQILEDAGLLPPDYEDTL